MDTRVKNIITRLAIKRGIDPEAALAVASTEGGIRFGAVGDNGTSFGPFQLHVGGALPKGKGSAFANSEAGVAHALDGMLSARGLQGRSAIAAIVRDFERPAKPDAEIAKAASRYGSLGDASSSVALPSFGGGGGDTRMALLNFLAQRSQAIASGEQQLPGVPDLLKSISLFGGSSERGTEALSGSQRASSVFSTDRAGSTDGRLLSFSSAADRPGASTRPAVRSFAERVASVYGQPLTVGTGTNHDRLTVDGNVSDHWEGNAVDIPLTGAALTKAGQSALVAAGADPAWASQQKGGLFNINGHQVIFNTTQGGNHWNHLHISAK